MAFVAIFLLTLAHCSTIKAAAPLENTYPTIPGTITPDTIETPLPVLFKYIYNLSIILAGAIAFVVTVWGGLKYLFAGPKPGKLTDAREQIGFGLLGMVLIFASYLIVNTINPDFTKLTVILPVDRFDTTPIPPDIDTNLPNIGLYEIPIGSIITSEWGASSFLATTSPDIDYSTVDWPIATTSTSTYDTDFQGALFGARLRRIHEIASTTVPIAKKLHELNKNLKNFTDKCTCMLGCQGNVLIACTTSADCGCDSGSLCGDDTKEKIETKIDEIGYLKDAFKAFLNPDSLVEDYYNDNQSDIDGLDDDEIKDYIQMMIDVENKGGYSPEIDVPERDIGRNFFEMTALLNDMKKMKRMINPYDQEIGYLNLMTFAEATTLENNTAMKSTIYNYYATFASGLEKIDEKNDPATFYSAAALPFPYGAPSTDPLYYNQDTPEPDLLPYLDEQRLIYPENTVYAQDPFNQPNVQMNFDTPPTTGGTCNYIVEIPIGRALDEAIKLTQAINKELFNIFVKGHLEIVAASMIRKAAEEFIDMECADACIQPTCVVIEPPVCVPPLLCLPTPETILWHASTDIAMWLITITTVPSMGIDIENIETSFKKLNSEEPLLTDYVCKDINGNCRKSNGRIDVNKIEEKEYTLEEKLIQVQKLLNRSRELSGQHGGKSVYELLLEDLIALGYNENNENTNSLIYIRHIDAVERTDLQNCNIMSETILKIGKKTYGKSLVNCRNAKLLDMLDFHNTEICSPDPYIDANYYLDPMARNLRPISCYCYDEDANKNYYNKDRFPELYQDISVILPTFAANTEDMDLDALRDLINQWQNARIDFNNFSGFGNNYFCCIKESK